MAFPLFLPLALCIWMGFKPCITSICFSYWTFPSLTWWGLDGKPRGDERLWVNIWITFIIEAQCLSEDMQLLPRLLDKIERFYFQWQFNVFFYCFRTRGRRESIQRRGSGGKHHPRLCCWPRVHTGKFNQRLPVN